MFAVINLATFPRWCPEGIRAKTGTSFGEIVCKLYCRSPGQVCSFKFYDPGVCLHSSVANFTTQRAICLLQIYLNFDPLHCVFFGVPGKFLWITELWQPAQRLLGCLDKQCYNWAGARTLDRLFCEICLREN